MVKWLIQSSSGVALSISCSATFGQLAVFWATFRNFGNSCNIEELVLYFSNITRISMTFCLFFATIMKIRHVKHLFSGQARIRRLDL